MVIPPASLADLGLTSPSRHTEPDQALADAAAELAAAGPGGLDLAERAADWTSRAFTYGHGTTTVATTAAQALAGGRGVCQDYAHVLLSILCTAGLAARTCPGTCSARAAPRLGRDHGPRPGPPRPADRGRPRPDQRPPGRLSSSKRVGVTSVEYGLTRG